MAKSAALVKQLETFFEDEWIVGEPRVVKSGKEATVYCCQASPHCCDDPWLAAKVYRPRTGRSFRNDAIYREGQIILDRRIRRAVKKKSQAGRDFQFSTWVSQEFSTLSLLHGAGAAVPKPYASTGDAILMEFIGEGGVAAPRLVDVSLQPCEARRLFDDVVRTAAIALDHNLVHGDLSAFNILYSGGAVTVIDFPQAVDIRYNSAWKTLLTRDLDNVCAFFADYGVREDPARIARDLWRS